MRGHPLSLLLYRAISERSSFSRPPRVGQGSPRQNSAIGRMHSVFRGLGTCAFVGSVVADGVAVSGTLGMGAATFGTAVVVALGMATEGGGTTDALEPSRDWQPARVARRVTTVRLASRRITSLRRSSGRSAWAGRARAGRRWHGRPRGLGGVRSGEVRREPIGGSRRMNAAVRRGRRRRRSAVDIAFGDARSRGRERHSAEDERRARGSLSEGARLCWEERRRAAERTRVFRGLSMPIARRADGQARHGQAFSSILFWPARVTKVVRLTMPLLVFSLGSPSCAKVTSTREASTSTRAKPYAFGSAKRR